ncbi:MAG TPA: CDP-glucose 4,6-dehydratase [Planctomycetota bacterium]|nr:CDP-glucose 4,6-dehydratase [Planctomycetota bacterium]
MARSNRTSIRPAPNTSTSALLEQAFKNKRVLVTGHTGFKGSWLCSWLTRLGADVTGYALPPATKLNLFETLNLAKKMRHIVGDVRDLSSLFKALQESKADYVFHLAAQPLVRSSYKDPKTTFDTNVGGTVNVFEALRAFDKARVFINVTSDKCYDNREWIWGYRENDPMGGHDPYSASKGCAELVFAAYQKSFFSPERAKEHGLGLASVRAGNVIGGGDWAQDRIVPDCIRALSENKRPGIRNPSAIRPWQHVLEPLGGYLKLAANLYYDPVANAGAWNFGPLADNCRTVRDVASSVVATWGRGGWDDLSEKQGNAVHEAHFLRLSCEKAMSVLRWKPVWDFDATMRLTTEWYKTFYQNKSAAAALCDEQITAYMNAVK